MQERGDVSEISSHYLGEEALDFFASVVLRFCFLLPRLLFLPGHDLKLFFALFLCLVLHLFTFPIIIKTERLVCLAATFQFVIPPGGGLVFLFFLSDTVFFLLLAF